MRYLFCLFLVTLVTVHFHALQAQQNDSSFQEKDIPPQKKSYLGKELPGRDFLLIQLGYMNILNAPDTINEMIRRGFHRTFNISALYDIPFKKKGKFSFAAGLGGGFYNMYIRKGYLDIIDSGSRNLEATFYDLSDTNYYNISKLTTINLEFPLELRFSSNPTNFTKGLKIAIGMKLGILLNSYTKRSQLRNRGGNELDDFKIREYSRDFVNVYNWHATFRIGWGIVTLHTSYQLNSLFRNNRGPRLNPLLIGITISGL